MIYNNAMEIRSHSQESWIAYLRRTYPEIGIETCTDNWFLHGPECVGRARGKGGEVMITWII